MLEIFVGILRPAAILLVPVFATAQSFTLSQILSAPLSSNLTLSPGGDSIAWVVNAQGARNIWIARSPQFAARAITRFDSDDGQEISDLEWTPDGKAVLFSRGGANPASKVAAMGEQVWIAPLDGDPGSIGEGHSPHPSPDGTKVVWIRDGRIWFAPLDGSREPGQFIHDAGRARDLAWSPDGRQLAFVSDRGDHAFIGVYDAAGDAIRWMDPSVDTDRSPVWSPDAKQIAFIRSPAWLNETGWSQAPRPAGEPWSVRVAEVANGSARTVFGALPGAGSVFWPIRGEKQLLWAAAGNIIFPWERDGWLHLYSLRPDRKALPVLLTSGFFEIETAALSPDGASVVFSSNQGDPERRHIWRVPVSGGAPDPLTQGPGIEWDPAPLKDGSIAVLRSDAKLPSRVAVIQRDGMMRDLAAAPVPPGFPAADRLVAPEPVTFKAEDGLTIHGQLFRPPASGHERSPAVVFFHGGPRRQMLLGWHPMEYYSNAYAFNQYLASRGYVVLSVNYRSGTGYGTGFREPLNYGATGAVEFKDALAAARYLEARSDVDPKRIGAWGGSYGGYMTALGLARASDIFAAGVDFHGVHDWNLEFPANDPRRSADTKKLAFESSPLAAIESWRSPVLLIQGDDDHNVAFAQTMRLVEALRAQSIPFEQLIFPNEVHEFLLHSTWLRAYQTADDFLAKHLKPGAPNKKP